MFLRQESGETLLVVLNNKVETKSLDATWRKLYMIDNLLEFFTAN